MITSGSNRQFSDTPVIRTSQIVAANAALENEISGLFQNLEELEKRLESILLMKNNNKVESKALSKDTKETDNLVPLAVTIYNYKDRLYLLNDNILGILARLQL